MGLRLFLGHGASGTAASMAPFVDGLVARGVDATAIDLPATQGRGRPAGVPPGRARRARGRGGRPLVRRSRREPGRRRAGLPATTPWSCSAIRCIRPAPPSGPMHGSPTGRRSAVPSCSCRASPTRSRGSSCCVPLCLASPTRSWSPTRGSATRSSRSWTTSWTASRPSCRPGVDRARILKSSPGAATPPPTPI